jgi:hypothetical protein
MDENNSQAADDALSSVQFTDVHALKLQPGGRLEFERTPEPGTSFSFIVVGRPDQMSVSLRDPNGRVITPSTSDSHIQYMQLGKDFLPITSYTISNPTVGSWTTIVEANAQTPPEGVSVAAFGSLVSDLRLNIPTAEAVAQVYHPVAVTAQLLATSTPILGANVTALLVQPGGATTAITLLDDGQHGDGSTGDGIYGYLFTPQAPGVYSAVISAAGTAAGASFSRSAVWATQVYGESIFLPFIHR